MRAFKKLMAGAIATAIAATMATSAFAAGFDAETGKVTAEYTAVGQTTVLVVPADVWVNNAITGLEDADILYIDQYETADAANTAIAAGFGVKLDETGTLAVGNYYALFGGNTGVDNAFAITAVPFEVKAAEPEEPDAPATKTIQLGDCDGATGITGEDALTVLKHISGAITLEGDALIAADCDGATGITGEDSLTVLKHVAGALTLGTVEVPVTNN